MMPPTSHLQSSDATTTPPRTPESKRTPEPEQKLLLTRVGSPGSLRALLRADAAARRRALGPDNAVEAPAGCEEDLWIDIHVVEAFNDLHALWEQVGLDEKCRAKLGENPPTAGDRTYAWDPDSDDDDTIVAWDLPAADYVARTFESFTRASRDRAVFPEPDGGAFPAGFRPGARKACGRLLRCWMHLYHNHFSAVAEAGRADAANACFKRFLTIALRYELVDRAELAPIEDLAQGLLAPRRTVDAKALAGEEG